MESTQTLKTSESDFDFFKSECLRFQREWGLNNWTIIFLWLPIQENRLAQVGRNAEAGTATIELNTEWDYPVLDHDILTQIAKEEMLHVLLGHYSDIAESRYTSEDTLFKAEHEVIQHLIKLIPSHIKRKNGKKKKANP
jgi:hypothetical protein